MRKIILVVTLLTSGICFSGQAQTAVPAAPTAQAAVIVPNPPRAATVLALAAPAPLPADVADLAAPLPANYAAPAAATRPTDGLQTTRVVLGIAAAAVALLAAILAVSK